MPPAPNIPASSRRSKRVIDSPTPSSSSPDPLLSEGEEDEDEEEEEEVEVAEEDEGEEDAEGEEEEEDEDAQGEEYESEDDPLAMAATRGISGVSSAASVSEDMDPSTRAPTPSDTTAAAGPPGLKLKFRVNSIGSGRPSRQAAKKARGRSKKYAEEGELASDEFPEEEEEGEEDAQGEVDDDMEVDELGSVAGSSRRSASPSKLTARQRAKGNKDLQQVLLELPNEPSKKLVLTEAERLQRREEISRRRKRQSEQKLQDEQDQTINRLLRAQTGRSRAKLDVPGADDGGAEGSRGVSRVGSPARRAAVLGGVGEGDMIRWRCGVDAQGSVVMRVGVPLGKDEWLEMPRSAASEEGGGGKRRLDDAGCAVKGCTQRRKYRCVRAFELGGCSMEHLKLVDAGLKA